ncbi:MAG: hypothetical protein A2832_01360 [Candidatus Zambryskibacteria bacterium RIFCSPHIGHO2_01_FULL_44_22b]|uniref:TrbL/VirB6 plasmid conjugal transfer protein n=1 Tax=Candidatus Zambryskibacteria bacterium RIFCSPHIGHO2_01_FULL_44_22b TaxID=1802737 RepID=A0A1G2T188_9BACT|nr:MAG: hypothetical protein A2832_01360 [Candidatus Zambryskibacteria bacterium RIFCSPHIGHO2_01_FULL_44_22b]
MKKDFLNISPLLLALALIFSISGFLSPQIVSAQAKPLPPSIAKECPDGQISTTEGCQSKESSSLFSLLNPIKWAADAVGSLASTVILQLASLLTYLSAMILNFVIKYSVVDMKSNIAQAGAIDLAWRTMRDLANMCFIFILLYAAIQTILGIGEDARKLIVKVIVVAILINFSLFATKLVIDASNILALTFYDAIAPGAVNATGEFSLTQAGIANSLMEPLGVQSIWQAKGNFGSGNLFVIGIMGTIVSLIAAFVFFAIAIMFVIRFVVLILVMILSPLAFLGFVLPEVKKQVSDKWKDALIGQAFFAPIYFILTWIVIVVSRGLFKGGGSMVSAISGVASSSTGGAVADPTAIGILVNFIIMIVLLMASIIIAKEWANKAPGGVSKLTSWAMGAAGGATLGMAGRFGRGTVGRAGQALGDSEKLKAAVARGGAGGIAARLALATGRKTGGASFDVRGMGALGALDAGKAQKGGFAKYREEKAKDEAKFAASLGPSDKTLAKAERAVKEGKEGAAEKLDELKGVKKKDMETREKDAMANDPILKKRGELEEETKKKEAEIASTQLPKLKKQREEELVVMQQELEVAKQASEAREKEIRSKYRDDKGEIKEIKSMADKRKDKFAEVVENSYWNKFRGYNYAAAAQIRKGKSEKDKLADAAKKILEEETEGKPSEEKGTESGGEEKEKKET